MPACLGWLDVDVVVQLITDLSVPCLICLIIYVYNVYMYCIYEPPIYYLQSGGGVGGPGGLSTPALISVNFCTF